MDRKIFVFAMSIAFGIVLMNIISMRNMYILKDKDDKCHSDLRECKKQRYRSYGMEV